MRRASEQVRYLRDEDLGVELLSARYVTHRFGLHTHDTYVVGVVVDGAARFTSAGNSYLSPRGTVMLIEPEEAHTGGAAGDAGWTYRMMYPSPALLARVAEQVTAGPAHTPSFGPRVIEDAQLARALYSAHAAIERRADALEKEFRLLHAFGLLIHRYGSGAPRSKPHIAHTDAEHAVIADRVRRYVERHFADHVTLGELAAVAEVSRFHLVRIATRQLGLPPHAYVNQVRVRRAKDLLLRGVAPAEVAMSVGFCDQSHFGRHFKRTVGVSPARFAALSSRT